MEREQDNASTGGAQKNNFNTEEIRLIEKQLADEVAIAKKKYETANAYFKEMTARSRNIGSDHPDGAFALRKAIHNQQTCLLRYSKAVRDFTNFIVTKQVRDDTSQGHDGDS